MAGVQGRASAGTDGGRVSAGVTEFPKAVSGRDAGRWGPGWLAGWGRHPSLFRGSGAAPWGSLVPASLPPTVPALCYFRGHDPDLPGALPAALPSCTHRNPSPASPHTFLQPFISLLSILPLCQSLKELI